MAPQYVLLLRKLQHKMQEERRLQQFGDDICPVDDLVKVVQLSGVVERIINERNQTEDIEVRRTWRGPAPQQHINADTQINQRNQPPGGIHRTVSGRKDQVGNLNLNSVPDQAIAGFVPGT